MWRYTWRWRCRFELDNTFLSARLDTPQMFVAGNKLCASSSMATLPLFFQPQPLRPVLLTAPEIWSPFSFHLFSRLSIHVTQLTSPLFSLTCLFCLSLNLELLFRLFSCLEHSISPLRSNFALLFPSKFHCVTISLAHHSKHVFLFFPYFMPPHHIK